jgi:hypothetical protein
MQKINFSKFPSKVKTEILNLLSFAEYPMTFGPTDNAKYKNEWNDFLYDLKCEITKSRKSK